MNPLVTARARYRCVGSRVVPALVATPMPPTLCVSDTHLVPHATSWSDDAPDDLRALLAALPTHAVLSLGDFAESIGLRRARRRELATAPRTAALIATLRARAATIVVGNHDDADLLDATFGAAHVRRGGLAHGALRIRHGHEAEGWVTHLEHAVGPWAVPPFEHLERWRGGGGRKDNRRVRRAIGGDAPFVLFGHSHVPALAADFANPGCFLASAQSFLLLDGATVELWMRD